MMKRKMFGSDVEFATFGTNAIAYVRPIDAKDFGNRFPEAQPLPQDQPLFALFAADGAPLAVADEEAALFDNAIERDLMPVVRQ